MFSLISFLMQNPSTNPANETTTSVIITPGGFVFIGIVIGIIIALIVYIIAKSINNKNKKWCKKIYSNKMLTKIIIVW